MDGQFIVSAIGSLGFPIVACCIMFAIYYKMTEAINELSLAINTLVTKFDDHVSKVE